MHRASRPSTADAHRSTVAAIPTGPGGDVVIPLLQIGGVVAVVAALIAWTGPFADLDEAGPAVHA